MVPSCSGLVSILLLLLLLATGCVSYVRVCYYTNWSQSRPEPSRFTPEDVEPTLCTHIIFAFAEVRGTAIGTTAPNDKEMYRRLVEVKKANPSLRVLLSLGGWEAGGAHFSSLVSSEGSMLEFVGNLIDYLRLYGFDGVDIDWEYPGEVERGSVRSDRFRFTRLLQLLREGFEDEAWTTGKDRLLVTAAVVPTIELSRSYYQIPQIARSVDFINLMAYDFHGDWDLEGGARHHSALYPETHEAVSGWLEDGFPAQKMVLGMAAFARTFTLASRPRLTGVGQPVLGVGTTGNFSDSEGLLTYQEVCGLLRYGGWQRVWLEEQSAPVALGNVSGGWEWAGYDDVDSITAKARYVKQKELAGAMVWAMSNDDFNNHCGQGAWPLLSTLKRELPDDDSVELEPVPTVRTVAPADTTTTPVTSPSITTSSSSATPAVAETTSWRTEEEEEDEDEEGPRAKIPVVRKPSSVDTSSGYRQCNISQSFGPSLRCPKHQGKRGSRAQFYLYCFQGFFAIECSCLPGFFYNRCLKACDVDSNFLTCPFLY